MFMLTNSFAVPTHYAAPDLDNVSWCAKCRCEFWWLVFWQCEEQQKAPKRGQLEDQENRAFTTEARTEAAPGNAVSPSDI